MQLSEKELIILIKLIRFEIEGIHRLPHLDQDYLDECTVLYKLLVDQLGEDPFEH